MIFKLQINKYNAGKILKTHAMTMPNKVYRFSQNKK